MQQSKKLLLFTILALKTLSVVAAPQDDYQTAMQAFKEGNYTKAERYFSRAEEAGMKSDKLKYNLGATYYKLGDYRQSRQYFQQLVGNPEWGALAQYNLGLLAEAEGDDRAAEQRYADAYDAASSPNVRRLAVNKLRQYRPVQGMSTEDKKWRGLLSASVGYNDNANLAPDTIQNNIGEEGDAFTELLGVGSYYLKGDYSDGYRLDIGGYSRLYLDESDFNYSALFAGISRDKQWNQWHTQMGLRFNTSLIDDDYYASRGTFRLIGDRELGKIDLRLRNDLSIIEADSNFDYVSGFSNRSTIEISRNINRSEFSAGYSFEYNDRDDLRRGNEFFSYSPYRNDFFAEVEYQLAPKWIVELRGEYQKSLYQDDNREIAADGTVQQDERDDDRITLSLRGDYEFARDLTAFAEYRYIDNSSNFERYEYDSNEIMIGIQKRF